MHPNSVLLFERHALGYFHEGASVLEIGPDADPSTYRALVRTNVEWATADLATTANVLGGMRFSDVRHSSLTLSMEDEYHIPVPDATFDIVVSGQVIEHVREVWRWMPETARVCRPGGVVITISPISWPYHPAPIDCWRIYPDGMAALCAFAGLEVELLLQGSLEPRLSRNSYPGPSHRSGAPSWRSRIADLGRRVVGWPTPIAIDLLTVARKR